MNSKMIKIALVLSAAVLGFLASRYGPFKGKQDNIIEETAEQVIKDETGIDVDITPTSKE